MNNGICPKCGGQVLNNQHFCSYCGYQISYTNNNINNDINNNINNNISNNTSTGKLIITREKNFYGCAARLTILINGYSYSLSNGGRLEFDLAPGVYNITWKFWCRRDKSVQINIMPGNWYSLEFKPDYFWGGFKLTDRCKFY